MIITISKKAEHTHNIPNSIARHNHNNCEHHVIKQLNNIYSIVIIMILE